MSGKEFWFVEGWETEHDLDYGGSTKYGPFDTEEEAEDYAKRNFDEGLWSIELIFSPK